MSTNRNQANGYLSQILPAMNELLCYLEDAKTRYADPNIYSTHMATSINHAWKILDKYEISIHLFIYSIQVLGRNGPNTAGVTGAENPFPRSPLVFSPFMPGTCTVIYYY